MSLPSSLSSTLVPLGCVLPKPHVLQLFELMGFDVSTLTPSDKSLQFTLYALKYPIGSDHLEFVVTSGSGTTTYILLFKKAKVVHFTKKELDCDGFHYTLTIDVPKIKSLLTTATNPYGDHEIKKDPSYEQLHAQITLLKIELQEVKEHLSNPSQFSVASDSITIHSYSWHGTLTNMCTQLQTLLDSKVHDADNRDDINRTLYTCKQIRLEHGSEHDLYVHNHEPFKRLCGMFRGWELTYEQMGDKLKSKPSYIIN